MPDIVIYPEVVLGNPLDGTRIVRYLLNQPGFFGGPHNYDADEYILRFSRQFKIPGRPSRYLSIPLVDRTIFKRGRKTRRRRGYLLYTHRHEPDLSAIPNWVSPRTVISMKEWREPSQLARLYRRSKALVVWERTAAVGEAMRCGCPAMIIPHPGFDYRALVTRCFGLGYTIGWNRRGVGRALRTVRLLEASFALTPLLLDIRLHGFVRDVCRYFDALGRPTAATANSHSLNRLRFHT